MTERVLIRGGTVLTLGARSTNHPEADVLVEEGRITEVGPRLRARDAEVIDATDTIVMPGFVDTHRHAWMSLFRNAGDDVTADQVGPHHQPDDLYAGTLIGLLGAARAGVTTVVDWADGAADDEGLEAIAQAHTDSGIRTVLVHAAPAWQSENETLPAVGVGSLPDSSVRAYGAPDPDKDALDRSVAGWTFARDRGVRIHTHVGRQDRAAGTATAMAGRGLLGDDVTLVHCSGLDDADLDAIASSGTQVSITPSAEMAGGLGSPPMQRLIDRSIRPGLGIEDELMGPGDIFAQIRTAISIQHGHHFDLKLAGKGGLPNLLTTREVIRYGTIDGAKVAGLEHVTGSIEPGKRADIIVLRTDRPNIHPVNDPIGAVVWGMDTSNVSWVIADGRILMREGSMEADVAAVRSKAIEAHARVTSASGPVGARDRG